MPSIVAISPAQWLVNTRYKHYGELSYMGSDFQANEWLAKKRSISKVVIEDRLKYDEYEPLL